MARADLSALGEFGLIARVRRRAGKAGGRWVRSIGDDAAVLRPAAGRDLVVTADALIEEVHFRWSTTDGRALGRKALAVNVSDVAAMGARPIGFVLCLGLPPDAASERIDALISGLLAEARVASCPLVGGDTVRAASWTLTVTAFGEVARGRALRRDGARPGDRICVTGALGGSALGLHLLESRRVRSPAQRRFARRHLQPRPPYEAGPRLVRGGLASAGIDISDGLVRDLGHLLEESAVGADVELGRVPLAPGLRKACADEDLDPEALALAGGEDYELLFTVPPRAPDAGVLSRRLGHRVTEIGKIRRGRGARFLRGGVCVTPAALGFDHFKPVG